MQIDKRNEMLIVNIFEHVMRRSKLENTVITGKRDGEKARGRHRHKYLDHWLNGMTGTRVLT